MLQYFVITKYREMNEEKIKNSIINSELSYEQILINETQKSLVFQKRKRGLRRRTVEQSEHENNPRNVEVKNDI